MNERFSLRNKDATYKSLYSQSERKRGAYEKAGSAFNKIYDKHKGGDKKLPHDYYIQRHEFDDYD